MLSLSRCTSRRRGDFHGVRHGKIETQKQYQIAFNTWKRCRKIVDGQAEHFEGIHDRFLRDQVFRDSQLKIGSIEQKCIEIDKLAQEDHSHRLSRDAITKISKKLVSHIKQIGQECADATSIRFSRSSDRYAPSPPWSRRRTCRTHFSPTISEMEPFFFKCFLVELGHVQKLVEFTSSILFPKKFVAVGFVYSW